jgi:Zn-dependent M28 family amino/carboxypeptidase
VAAIEMDEGAERPLGFGYGAFPPAVFLSTGGPSEVAPKSPEEEASRQLCRQIARLLVRVQATEVASFGGGSDIEPIVKLGVPSLSPTTTAEHYFDWHHTQADTFDKVDPGDFRKNVAVLAVLSYVLADMPGRLAGSTAP